VTGAHAGVPALDLTPAPGSASPGTLLVSHARWELTSLLRNGEQLLLTVVIPTLLLVLFAKVDVVDLGPGSRIAFLAPGILALAVLSTAFTAQAISTGFERRYGVLRRLGTTPLPRWGLLGGKTLAVLGVEVLQVVLLGAVAVALGWRPQGAAWGWVVVLLALGTAAASGLALLMAGTLRAEATLACANLLYLVLLLGGGIVIPLAKFPGGVRRVLEWLPSTALADGLRAALTGAGLDAHALVVLALWSLVTLTAAARWFRWD
jgi:ABC-2 type transport system permease protein